MAEREQAIKAIRYWNKSVENRKVADWANSERHYNAAASRYYYALRLAAQAAFELRDLSPLKSSDPDYWDHDELLDRIARVYNPADYPDLDTERWFKKAREFRVKGDYKQLPVESENMQLLLGGGKKIFTTIRAEIETCKTGMN